MALSAPMLAKRQTGSTWKTWKKAATPMAASTNPKAKSFNRLIARPIPQPRHYSGPALEAHVPGRMRAAKSRAVGPRHQCRAAPHVGAVRAAIWFGGTGIWTDNSGRTGYSQMSRTPHPDLDFHAVFDHSPSLVLVLDPGFKIAAQNRAHAAATLSAERGLVGKNLFEAFPENPDHNEAEGLSLLRASLLRVLKNKEADTIEGMRHDVRGLRGPYQTRWWRVINTPILGDDGYVRWIVNRAEDITELVELRTAAAKVFPKK
jgi:PAS domain-containing protein